MAAYQCTLEYRRGTADYNVNFLSRLLQEAAEEDASEVFCLCHPENIDVCSVGASGLRLRIPRNVSHVLHSDSSQNHATVKPIVELSTNGNRVLLDVDNTEPSFMVIPVSRDPPVQFTFGGTSLQCARTAQRAMTSNVSLPPTTKPTTTPPHDDDDAANIMLDPTSPLSGISHVCRTILSRMLSRGTV